MKNLNKVRDIHPVAKIIYFKDMNTANLFVEAYKNLFFRPISGPRSKDSYVLHETNWFEGYSTTLWITIVPDDWNKIEEKIKLNRVNKNRTREWFFN